MKTVDIPRCERINPILSINVFEYNTDEDNEYKVVALYISKYNENRRIFDLISYKNHYKFLKNTSFHR